MIFAKNDKIEEKILTSEKGYGITKSGSISMHKPDHGTAVSHSEPALLIRTLFKAIFRREMKAAGACVSVN